MADCGRDAAGSRVAAAVARTAGPAAAGRAAAAGAAGGRRHPRRAGLRGGRRRHLGQGPRAAPVAARLPGRDAAPRTGERARRGAEDAAHGAAAHGVAGEGLRREVLGAVPARERARELQLGEAPDALPVPGELYYVILYYTIPCYAKI